MSASASSSAASSPGFPPPNEPLAILAALVGGGRYGFKIRLPHALVMTTLFRRELSARDKLRSIVKLSMEHATNLAAFAAIYKTVLAALKWASNFDRRSHHANAQIDGGGGEGDCSMMQAVGRAIIRLIIGSPELPSGEGQADGYHLAAPPARAPGLPDHPLHALLAGAAGGYLIWGRYSSINYQIVLYLLSRVVIGTATLAREKGVPPFCWDGLRFERSYRLGAAVVWGAVMVLFEEYPHVLHPSLTRSMEEIYRYVPRCFLGGWGVTSDVAASMSQQQQQRRLESATTIDFSIEDAAA